MGQRFTPVILDEDKIYRVVTVKEKSTLMGHSWINNVLMANIYLVLAKSKGSKVWWVGENAIASDFKPIYMGEILCNIVHKEKMQENVVCLDKITKMSVGKINMIYSTAYPHIVNLDKKEYIRIPNYIKKATVTTGDCVHPLSLLTAVGNNYYQGDYNGINDDLVGSWAGDTLRVSRCVPNGFKSITQDVIFKQIK